MIIRTIKDLKEVIENMPDDFAIGIRVRRKLTDEELEGLDYPYHFETADSALEYDDTGWSDKTAYFGVERI